MGSIVFSLSSGATSTGSATFNGATFNVSNAITQGSHVDGTPWFEIAPTESITSTSPPSATLSRTTGLGTFSRKSHGLQMNPGAAPSGTTLAQKQSSNHGLFTTDQGIDELVQGSSAHDYSDPINIDPANTGNPVPATPAVYLKGVSLLNVPNSKGDGVVSSLVPLTLYAPGNAPANDAFRPALAQGGFDHGIRQADMDLNLLGNLDVSGYSGSLPTVDQFMQMVGVMRRVEIVTYGVLAESLMVDGPIFGALSADVYDGFFYEVTGMLILALNTNRFTLSEKLMLSTALGQMGIDGAGRAREGGVWQDNGGHCHGIKELVTFIARLTGAAYLSEPLAYTTTIADTNVSPASIWGTDRQHFNIAQADIDRARNFPYSQSQLGHPEWSSDATRDLPGPADNGERQNTLLNEASGSLGNGPLYRNIIAKANVPATLGLQAMGARTLHGNETVFDYADRHMQARIANNGPLPNGGAANDIHPFARYTWEQHRAGLGNVWAA